MDVRSAVLGGQGLAVMNGSVDLFPTDMKGVARGQNLAMATTVVAIWGRDGNGGAKC